MSNRAVTGRLQISSSKFPGDFQQGF